MSLEGGRQAVGYAEITENERVYLAVNAYPPLPIIGCLPHKYITKTSTLDRQTSTTGNHTTHRDITIHYCQKG